MRTLLSLLFFGVSVVCYSQSGAELDKRNGFKDIKLLTEAPIYPGLEFVKDVKDKPDHAIFRAKKGQYERIGNVEISKVTILTYRNLIYQIEVVVDKNEQLYRSLERAFGKINSSIASNNSYWEGKKVRLTYAVENSKKVKLIYASKEIRKIIAEDKKKDIDSLATEF